MSFPAKPVDLRFEQSIERIPIGGCWLWMRSTGNYGYGQFALTPQRQVRAHRYSYEARHGPIPAGMVVCHRCDNPCCVNPEHLFLGTQRDNIQDCIQKGRFKKHVAPPPKTHCVHGHEYTAANSGFSNGHRYCKECRNSERRVEVRQSRFKTHCKRGHDLSGENVRLGTNGKARHCRLCEPLRYAARQSAKTATVPPGPAPKCRGCPAPCAYYPSRRAYGINCTRCSEKAAARTKLYRERQTAPLSMSGIQRETTE